VERDGERDERGRSVQATADGMIDTRRRCEPENGDASRVPTVENIGRARDVPSSAA
jgi:hypothetical protein